MASQLWLLTACIVLCSKAVSAASVAGTVWKVYDETTHDMCIQMQATVRMNLSYFLDDTDETMKTVMLKLPSHAAVNTHNSHCDVDVEVDGKTIKSQIIALDFDPGEQNGWSIQFSFTQDSVFHASHTEFTLYRVQVTANYSAYAAQFPGYDKNASVVVYQQPIDFSAPEPSTIADNIYADIHYSYSCDSEQHFSISSGGRPASVFLKKMRVQAFAPHGTTKFGDREVCPQDQTGDDIVPVIVGGVLAALVFATLVIYLVYRAKQPASVLYLTNPTSHLDDLAVMKARRDEDIEDDDEGSSQRAEARPQQHVARHLQEAHSTDDAEHGRANGRYSNVAFEE